MCPYSGIRNSCFLIFLTLSNYESCKPLVASRIECGARLCGCPAEKRRVAWFKNRLLLRQLKNIAWTQRQIGICRAESPRNSEPDRATLSIAQGVSPGYGVVIRPEPRQLAGWQIRMSVPFMLSIDYLHINAHPRLPPTRSARGSVTIFTLPQGLRPGLLNLPPRQ